MTENLEKLNIAIYPELIASAMAKKELDLYIVWRVLHASLQATGQTNQIVAVKKIRQVLSSVLGVTDIYAYAKFNVGVGIYWNAPGISKSDKKTKITGLIGAEKVNAYLGQGVGATRPFLVPLDDFVSEDKGWAQLKAMLFGFVAARNNGLRPVAIATLAKETGVSKSTVKRLLTMNRHLKVSRNVCEAGVYKSHIAAFERIGQLMKAPGAGNRAMYRTQAAEGVWRVYRQLPNSYRDTDSARGSMKSRPKELRRLYHDTDANALPRRFITPETKKMTPSGSPYYAEKCLGLLHSVGYVRIWTENNALLQSICLPFPIRVRKRTIFAEDTADDYALKKVGLSPEKTLPPLEFPSGFFL